MNYLVSGLFALGAVAIVLTALPFWRTSRWWIRIWDFPRFQIAMIGSVVFVVFSAMRYPCSVVDWLFLSALGGAVIWQFKWVGPYIRGTSRPVKTFVGNEPSNESISLFTTNVLMTNRDSDRLLEIIHQSAPDLILAVEVDEWWANRLSAGLCARYPHKICYPLSNGYGLALFARLELFESEVRFILDDAIPSIRTRVKLRSGNDISLYGVHPRPPSLFQDSTERDLELVRVAKEIEDRGCAAIVLGDLNDVAWSPTTIQFMKKGNLVDPRRGRGFFSTYPARWPGFRYPLDYVFCTRHFQMRSMRVLPAFGSDHLPLVAELVLSRPEPNIGRERT